MGWLAKALRRSAKAARACSHLAGTSKPPLRLATLGQAATEAAERWGNRAALHFPAEKVSLSFEEFNQEADQVAQGLLSLDLERGSRIGLLSPTCHRWIVCQFAAAKAGLVLVPINDRCHAHELEAALKRTACSALLVGEGFKKLDYSRWARDLVGDSRPPLSLHRYPDLKYVISLNTSDTRGMLTYDEIESLGRGRTWRLKDVNPDVHSTATMLHSSGSTGTPKIIPLSHFNLVNAARLFTRSTKFSPESTIMTCVMPLYHAFGHIDFCINGIAEGITTVYLAPATAPADTLACIEQFRCTAIQGTPTTYYDLICSPELKRRNFSSLCEGLIGATSLQRPALENIAEKLGIRRLVAAYGLTESSGPVSFCLHTEAGYKPQAHTEVRVVNEEIHLRGPTVFGGYWDHHESGLLPDGWLPTGDRGVLTEEGRLQVLGRFKDLVIKGGVNISPEEIELALTEHECVQEASVVGVPDERLGEELCAWVRLTPGAKTTGDELRRHCRDKVNSLKVPRYIEFVDDLPRTSVGKVSKPEIRNAMARKLGESRATA